MPQVNVEVEKEIITVERKSPYGVLFNEIWYNLDKPLSPEKFEVGRTYQVLSYFGRTGAKRIKGIVSNGSSTKSEAEVATVVNSASSASGYQKKQDEKSEQIKRQGLIQAAMQSPGLMAFASNKEEYWNLVLEFTEKGIKFVEGK